MTWSIWLIIGGIAVVVVGWILIDRSTRREQERFKKNIENIKRGGFPRF